MSRLKPTTVGIGAAFAGNFIFGFSFLFSKLGLAYAAPPVLLMWRFWLAFAVINGVWLCGGARLNLRGKPVWKL